MRGVSDSAHPYENCRQPQALHTFCAFHSPKPRGVSGSVHPHDGNRRPSQALCTPPSRKLWGVSGSAQPHDENCRPSQALCTPHPRSLWGVSDSGHPHAEIADSLRLWAFSVFSIHQNWGTSQALCTPMMKTADSLRLCAPPLHENCGASQAACTPYHKVADSLRLWALSVLSTHPNWGDVSGSLHPRDGNCRPSQALCTRPSTKTAGRLRLCAAP